MKKEIYDWLIRRPTRRRFLQGTASIGAASALGALGGLPRRALAQSDLRDSQEMLNRYFDMRSRKVAGVAELLRQVSGQARQVSVPRPDDTLAALTAAAAGR